MVGGGGKSVRREGWGAERSTDALDLELDPWAHDLVPPVDAPDQPAAAVEAARAAERVREGCGGREVGFYRLPLEGWGRLRESVDYGGDFGGWVFHGC